MIQPNFSLLKQLAVLSFASTLLLVGSSGCATRGYQKAAATSDAITEAANQVELAQRQITEATSALQALSTQNPRELQPAFERYRAAVAALEATANELRQQTSEMEKQGRAYFDLWDVRLGEIRNEDIRARSADRQREVTEQFAEIQRRYQDARLQLEPLVSNLRDIQGALGVDLTAAGVESAREFIGRTDASSAAARDALNRLGESLRSLGSTLDPSATPAPITTTS